MINHTIMVRLRNVRATRLQISCILFVVFLVLNGCSHRVDSTLQDDAAFQSDPDFEELTKEITISKFAEAEKRIQGMAHRHPENASILVQWGFICQNLQRTSEAFDLYQKAVKINPSNAKAWFNLGVMWGNLGKFNNEIKSYKRAIELRPNYAEAYYNLGLTYEEQNEKKKASDALQKAISLDPQLASYKPSTGWEIQDANREKSEEEPQETQSTESPQEMRRSPIPIVPSPAPAVPSMRSEDSKGEKHGPSFLKKEQISGVQPEGAKIKSQETNTIYKQLNNAGVALEKEEKWDDAIHSYVEALKLKADDAMVLNNLGMAYAGKRDLENSIKSFEKARRIKPNDSIINQNLAYTKAAYAGELLKQNQISEASPYIKNASELLPESEDLKLYYAHYLLVNHHPDEAKSIYEQLTRDQPSYSPAWIALAKMQMSTGEPDKALQNFNRALTLDSADPKIWYLKGAIEIKKELYTSAENSFSNCVSRSGQNSAAWEALAACAAIQNKTDSCRTSLEKALQINPASNRLQREMAELYVETGKPEKAIATFRSLLGKNDTDQALLWKSLGIAYESIDAGQSLNALKKSADLNKRDGETWAHLAYLASQNGDHKEASLSYDRAVYYGYKTADVWNNLGVCLSQLSNYEKALTAFSEAARLSKNDPDILINIGIVFHRQKRDEDAKEVVATLLKIAPEKARDLAIFISPDAKIDD